MNSQWRHYQRQWENLDPRKTRQMIHYLKGYDESFPKMLPPFR